jgi:hypothetical protein
VELCGVGGSIPSQPTICFSLAFEEQVPNTRPNNAAPATAAGYLVGLG